MSTLYRVGDRLYERREAILEGLFGNSQALLGFSETFVLFDLTNTFYTGRKKDELLAYGRSKENRSSSPLVTLALMLDGAGFVRNALVLPGHISEPKTLRQAIEMLGKAGSTIIMDAGSATEANLAYLKATGHHWICVQRSKTSPAPERPPDDVWSTSGGNCIKAWHMAQQDDEQRVYLQRAARKAKGDSILLAKRARFEAELQSLHEDLTKPRRLKMLTKVERKVGRLLEEHKRVAYQYKVDVLKATGSAHAKAVRFTHMSA